MFFSLNFPPSPLNAIEQFFRRTIFQLFFTPSLTLALIMLINRWLDMLLEEIFKLLEACGCAFYYALSLGSYSWNMAEGLYIFDLQQFAPWTLVPCPELHCPWLFILYLVANVNYKDVTALKKKYRLPGPTLGDPDHKAEAACANAHF